MPYDSKREHDRGAALAAQLHDLPQIGNNRSRCFILNLPEKTVFVTLCRAHLLLVPFRAETSEERGTP